MPVRDAAEPLPEAALRQMIALVPKVTSGLPLARKRVLWRNLVTRFPGERALAAEYAVALLKSESWDELAAFEAVARTHQSTEIDLVYVDAALARGDASGAERRLGAVEGRDGVSTATLWRRYDLQFLRRDFDAAIATAAELRRLSPADRRWAGDLMRKAAFYRALALQWTPSADEPRDYDIYVVNLDSDTVRMQRMARQLTDSAFMRVPGVKGAYLPNLLLKALTRGVGSEAKGTAGCFLSHLAVWERVARADRPALVLEDDAWLLAGLPPRLSDIRLPADFEVCFAAESFLPHRFAYRRKTFGLLRPGDIVPGKPAGWGTPSTVAYFVSPDGARTLLARVRRDGVAGDVDWRIVSYSLTATERRAALRSKTLTSRLLAVHDRAIVRTRRPLRAAVLVPALARYFEAGSVRLHDNGIGTG